MIPVFIINLRQDSERYSRITADLKKYHFVQQHRIDAVAGSTLPDQLTLAITGHAPMINNKGALGITLSHVRAWERVLAGPHEWALVLEDDALIRDWSDLPSLVFPDHFDIVFANNRTELPTPPTQGRVFTPIQQSLGAIEQRKQAMGMDCYAVSRAGAEKLLSAYKADGYGFHIDCRILAYVVSVEDAALELPECDTLQTIRSHFDMTKRAPFLTQYVLSPSLVSHRVDGETSRQREDRLGRGTTPG